MCKKVHYKTKVKNGNKSENLCGLWPARYKYEGHLKSNLHLLTNAREGGSISAFVQRNAEGQVGNKLWQCNVLRTLDDFQGLEKITAAIKILLIKKCMLL